MHWQSRAGGSVGCRVSYGVLCVGHLRIVRRSVMFTFVCVVFLLVLRKWGVLQAVCTIRAQIRTRLKASVTESLL